MGALEGTRILDFSRVLAGPFCTMLLGDMGAEVIKIEHPGRGDDTRHWGPPWVGDEANRQSAYFVSVNRNKRSLTLNLKTDEGAAIARQLAEQSQVVIENFKPGQMTSYGLGYETLRQINPALIYCAITGYGQTGPWHDHPGYDFVIQAISGLMSITGAADGPAYKVGVAISDVITGLNASTAIVAALRHSERTGQGQYIDIALLDSQLAALVNIASNALVSGETPGRLGNAHPNIVPYQTFRAADGEFVVAVGNDRQFAQLCQMIGQPGLADDPRFTTNPARVAHRDTLIPVLQAAFAEDATTNWVDRLLGAGIPAGPINDIPTILDSPQVQARGLVQETTLADGSPLKFVGPVAQFSATPAEVRLPPPALGQHTDAILRDVLGCDDTTIRRYHAEEVV
jgi:crotonobetainyl-CoA:carnitine CoA-transferase CaiB-like acyl-CoA transferase